MAEIKVGDTVNFVPGKEHAFFKDTNTNEYPWVMGWEKNPQGDVEELTTDRLEVVLNALRLHPDPERERKRLKFLRPNIVWNGVVKAVNNDGTVDVDVHCKRTGGTLHYKSVSVDPAKKTPHTCHKG